MTTACAICLAELRPEDEAFLDACFHHHFHFACIRRWAELQLEQPVGHHAPMLACPLCRQPFASVFYDCQDSAYRRHDFLPQTAASRRHAAHPGPGAAAGGGGSGSLPLTVHHRRRRAVYSSAMPAAQQQRLEQQLLGPSAARQLDLRAFVVRELQALMLQEEVGLVAQHVLATFQNAASGAPAAAAASAAGKPLFAKAEKWAGAPPVAAQMADRQPLRRAGSGAAGAPLPSVVAGLQAAAAPFIFEHAERFAWELAAFATSRCSSLAAYDRLSQQSDATAAAAAATEARQQLQDHRQQQAAAAAVDRQFTAHAAAAATARRWLQE
ncbi:hypothetical protein ACK3TF_004485 [Chlorella vulgaris]